MWFRYLFKSLVIYFCVWVKNKIISKGYKVLELICIFPTLTLIMWKVSTREKAEIYLCCLIIP